MEYLSPNEIVFGFDGWGSYSPTQCFDRGEWLDCLHGCMLALTIINDPGLTQIEISDDGVLHELLHLALGIDICTNNTMSELRTQVAELETLCLSIKETNGN